MSDSEVLERLRQLAHDEELPETARHGLRAVLRDRDRRGIRGIGVLERRLMIAADDCITGVQSTDAVMHIVSIALRRLVLVQDFSN